MKMSKKAMLAAVMSTAVVASHAMTRVADEELSSVTGQDGVSIGGDLNIKIGSFTWTDTDSTGGSVSFNNITVRGMFVQTIDVLNAETTVTSVINAMAQYVSGAQAITEAYKLITGGVYDGESDVVQFAFPNANLDTRLTPTIKIGSITNGHSTKSYGSLEIKNLDMQGTKIWLWAH